ncbi:ABC transporter ATP-binding protein [Brenneria goodwinii]|uniref:ABC transporter ATP-binding protein n=1 Tax=Brenneria goodwinii TaxID=1109412 RepID=UPI0036F05EB5
MASLSFKNLTITYGSQDIIRDLSLEINDGEFLVLLGPSGCGKSTLLNATAGLTDVKSGEVWIGDRNVTWEEPRDRNIAMVFQSYALYPRMTVRQNMSLGLELAKVARKEIVARVAEAAATLQITDLLDRRPEQLSGGQRQRVAIGRALVRHANVYLFDEPLSNLDAQLRNELRLEIKRLHKQLGTTMIYVTHDQIEALTLADRIAVMKDQVIQQIGTPAEIYHRPANLFVAGFVGSPKMNFLSGRFTQSGGHAAFACGSRLISLENYAFQQMPQENQPLILGIRPEMLLSKPGTDGCLPNLTIELIEPMGADTLAWCRGEDFTLAFRSHEAQPDEVITLWFESRSVAVFDRQSGQRL